MLKSELERRLKEAEEKAEDFSKDRIRLLREQKTKDEEIESLQQHLEFSSNQLKQISQSVYTMLQVKYPDEINNEVSEDKRFLMFLHGLCVDRNYNMTSAIDLSNRVH